MHAPLPPDTDIISLPFKRKQGLLLHLTSDAEIAVVLNTYAPDLPDEHRLQCTETFSHIMATLGTNMLNQVERVMVTWLSVKRCGLAMPPPFCLLHTTDDGIAQALHPLRHDVLHEAVELVAPTIIHDPGESLKTALANGFESLIAPTLKVPYSGLELEYFMWLTLSISQREQVPFLTVPKVLH